MLAIGTGLIFALCQASKFFVPDAPELEVGRFGPCQCQGAYFNDELDLRLQVELNSDGEWELVHPKAGRMQLTPRMETQCRVRSELCYQLDFVDFQEQQWQEIQLCGRDFARLKFRRVE
jgi:hypothetical protein